MSFYYLYCIIELTKDEETGYCITRVRINRPFFMVSLYTCPIVDFITTMFINSVENKLNKCFFISCNQIFASFNCINGKIKQINWKLRPS